MCAVFVIVLACGLITASAQAGAAEGCVLPSRPEHGTYIVRGQPLAAPGQTLSFAALTVTCAPGYRVVGQNETYCFGGNIWSSSLPQCIRHCQLTPHPSVKYWCKVFGEDQLEGSRLCHEFEPSGAVVIPKCNRPVYYYSGILLDMHCINGAWDHVAICQSDFGTTVARGTPLIINGTSAERGELPWHAAIYDTRFTPRKQICGGSLISNAVIISAAHCFWADGAGVRPPQAYAVALGAVQRAWGAAPGVHLSSVSSIKVPVRFMGEVAHFQDDIALVTLATPVEFSVFIRPVGIDFSEEFDTFQLQDGHMGKVAGWGLTSPDGSVARVLQTAELPYVETRRCIRDLPADFRGYVTSDKICAGYMNGTAAVCRGDSGGGLVFPTLDKGVVRYYLRGVVSTAPAAPTGLHCNANAYTTLTHVLKHATFIKDNALAPVTPSIDYGATTSNYTFPGSDGPGDRSPVISPEPGNRESPLTRGKDNALAPVTPSIDYGATTSNYTFPGSDGPGDRCPDISPERTPAATGSKSWEKCLEYQRQLVYPCEDSKGEGGGRVRGNHCNHSDQLIDGGGDAKRNEFPHMVLLGYGINFGPDKWQCDGTLINDMFILTAAHCTLVARRFPMVAVISFRKGSHNLRETQVRIIRRIIRHPDYSESTNHNDIALLELLDPIEMDQKTVPACLDVFEGDHSRAVATGWGVFPHLGNTNTYTLQKATLTKFTDAECKANYERISRSNFNSSIHVCYGDYVSNIDACKSHIGGPLTIYNHRLRCMHTVVAIFSAAASCGTPGMPRVYTRLAPYVPWIESIVWP